MDHLQQVIGPPDGRRRGLYLCYGPLTQATDTGVLHLWADSMATVECEKSHCLNTCCRGVRAATPLGSWPDLFWNHSNQRIVGFQTPQKRQRKQQTCESAPVLAFWKGAAGEPRVRGVDSWSGVEWWVCFERKLSGVFIHSRCCRGKVMGPEWGRGLLLSVQ